MSKITTEVCKAELNARWPFDGAKRPEDWKRVSKTGSAKTSIARVFQHRRLELYGIVIEEKGAITSVRFSETQPQVSKTATSRKSSPTASKNSDSSKPNAPGATAPGAAATPASNGKVRADEFLFAITRREDGLTYFAICREDFWRQNHHLSDQSFGNLLDGLLPRDASESSECQYCTKVAPKALRKFLEQRGFKDDERFTSYMGGDEF
jgi:hypothetical protein